MYSKKSVPFLALCHPCHCDTLFHHVAGFEEMKPVKKPVRSPYGRITNRLTQKRLTVGL